MRKLGLLSTMGLAAALIAATAPITALRPIAPIAFAKRKAKLPQLNRRGGARLNRSRHWRYAETYKEARKLSPFPDMPVR